MQIQHVSLERIYLGRIHNVKAQFEPEVDNDHARVLSIQQYRPRSHRASLGAHEQLNYIRKWILYSLQGAHSIHLTEIAFDTLEP